MCGFSGSLLRRKGQGKPLFIPLKEMVLPEPFSALSKNAAGQDAFYRSALFKNGDANAYTVAENTGIPGMHLQEKPDFPEF